MEIEKLKVPELREALKGRGLNSSGTKPILVQRLKVRILAIPLQHKFIYIYIYVYIYLKKDNIRIIYIYIYNKYKY